MNRLNKIHDYSYINCSTHNSNFTEDMHGINDTNLNAIRDIIGITSINDIHDVSGMSGHPWPSRTILRVNVVSGNRHSGVVGPPVAHQHNSSCERC